MIELRINTRFRESLERLHAVVSQLPPGSWRLTIEPLGVPGTRAQMNKYRHLLRQRCEHTGEEFDDAHRDMMRRAMPPGLAEAGGKIRVLTPSSSSLTKAQFSDLIERTQQVNAELGL